MQTRLILMVLGLVLGEGMIVGGARARATPSAPIEWQRHGEGQLRWMQVVPVYDSLLEVGRGSDLQAALDGKAPLALTFHYHRSFSTQMIRDGGEALLKRNLAAEEWALIASRVGELHAAYQAVQPGDRYRLEHVPGIGTTLRLNGKWVVTIPGDDFAPRYFRIWLGRDPLNAGLRDRLLGGF